MRIILHIGLHKTGSTSIQMSLGEGGEGFLYPQAGRALQTSIRYGHHRLPWSLSRDPADIGVWDALAEEIAASPCDLAIISSEEFDTLSAEEVAEVARRLPSAEVVMYMRRQDQFAQAMYGTEVLFQREAGSFDDYLPRMPTSPDYLMLYRRWAAHFPVQAIPYLRASLRDGDVVADFAARAGIRVQTRHAVNASFPRTIVELVRKMRVAGVKDEDVRELLRLAHGVYKDAAQPNDVLPPRRAEAFYRQFEAGNRELAALLGLDELFPDPDFGDQAAWLKRYRRPYAELVQFVRDCRTALVSDRPFWDA